MTFGEVLLIPGAIVTTLTAAGLVWKGWQVVRQKIANEAYERARADQLREEATKALAQKDIELTAKTTAYLALEERERRLTKVADEQRTIIDRLSRAFEALGGERQAVTE